MRQVKYIKNIIPVISFIALFLLVIVARDLLINGQLGTVSIIFLAVSVLIGAYLGLTNREKIKKLIRQRQMKYFLNFSMMFLISLAIFVFIYLLALNNDAQIDTTGNLRYSLSEQSRKIISKLDKDVHIYGFYGTYQKSFKLDRQGMDDLLLQYTLQGSKVSYRLYNINKEPEMAEKYEIKVPGTLVVTCTDKKEIVTDITEQNITNSIIRVTRSKEQKVYFLQGHGERDTEATDGRGVYYLNQQLKNLNYETEKLKLSLTGGIVPTDCDLLIVPGLQDSLFPIEWKGILDYTKRGGNIFIMIDPGAASDTVVELEKLGLKIGRDIIVMSQVSQLDLIMGNMYTPLTNNYGNTDITKDFDLQTIYDRVRSIETADKLPDGVTASTLVSTTENAHTEKLTVDNISNTMSRSGESLKEGPIPIAVTLKINTEKWTSPEVKLDKQEQSKLHTESIVSAVKSGKEAEVEKKEEQIGIQKNESRIVVVGDSEFVMDYIYGNRKGNFDFVMNTIAWLAHEEDQISVRPPHTPGTPIFLRQDQTRNIFWMVVIVLPLLVLLIGGTVLFARKRRYLKHSSN